MDAKAALTEIIYQGDFACLSDGRVLVVKLSPALEDFLAAFGSGDEDLEDDDPREDVEPNEDDNRRLDCLHSFVEDATRELDAPHGQVMMVCEKCGVAQPVPRPKRKGFYGL